MTLNTKTILLILLAGVFTISCNTPSKSPDLPTPKEYNLNTPRLTKLSLELDEISGISFYEKDSSIFAICDDKKAIFKINPNLSITKWKLDVGKDIEDLVRIDSTFYVMQSNGDIIKVRFEKETPITDQFLFTEGADNEFEAMYYDNAKKQLVLICKNCELDKKKSVSTYSFNPATNTFSDSSFAINVKSIDSSLGVEHLKFKPSAAAINPINGLLYILSSVNKLLLITDTDGNFKELYPLNPTLFKQPEGIAFKQNGDMIISNESHKIGTANLLSFKYQPTTK